MLDMLKANLGLFVDTGVELKTGLDCLISGPHCIMLGAEEGPL